MKKFLQQKNIKCIIILLLSVALFFTGILIFSLSESKKSSENITLTTQSKNEDPNNAATKSDREPPLSDTSTTKTDLLTTTTDRSTTQIYTSTSNNTENATLDNDKEEIQMVWIPVSGTKYHSKSSCSNMKSPKYISLAEAQNQGYTACKKCH